MLHDYVTVVTVKDPEEKGHALSKIALAWRDRNQKNMSQ
jgi:hypothetical protein